MGCLHPNSRLLSLNIAQIEHICNKAGVCVNEKNKLIKTMYEVQKGIDINTYDKLLDKKKYVFKSNELRTGNNHDLKNSGKKWSEMDYYECGFYGENIRIMIR